MILSSLALVMGLNPAVLDREIERAQTWYAWGRDANNPQSYFIRSKAHYSRACELILKEAGTSEAEIAKLAEEDAHCQAAEQRAVGQKRTTAAIARMGLEQSEFRIDNAWDSFRSRYPAVWWLIGEDPTLEMVDDLHMNAFGQAWEKLAVGIPLVKVARLPFLVRCHGGHEICGNYRDELLAATPANGRLHGIPDDRGRQLIGDDWDRLIASEASEPEMLVELGKQLDAPAVMVVDVRVADEFGLPPSERMEAQYCELDGDGELADGCMRVARAVMSYTVIKVAGGKAMAGGEAQAVAVDLTSRTGVRLGWILLWLMVALGFGVARGLRARKTVKAGKDDRKRQAFTFQILAGLGAFLAGGFIGLVAGDVSGNFAPDWGELSAVAVPGALEGLPRVGVILWPIVHGLVVMVGPAVLCAFVAIRYLPEWAMAWNTRMDADVIIPSAQAGAVATLFGPLLAYGLVEPMPAAWDWQVALSISLAALLTSVWLSRSIAQFLNVEANTTSLQIGLLVTGLLMMALLLPLGLFHGMALESQGWHLHVSAITAVLAIAGLLYFARPDSVYEQEEKRRAAAEDFKSDEGFGLGRPRFVRLQHQDPGTADAALDFDGEVALLAEEEGLRVLVLESESGLGKSRTAEEIRRTLMNDQRDPEGRDDEPDEWLTGYGAAQVGDEPYTLVQAVLETVGVGGDLSSREQQLDRSQRFADAMGEGLGLLPGGGLVSMAMGGDGEAPSQERIVHDVVRDLLERSENQNILLIFDDVEQADQSSLSVIEGMLRKLAESERKGDKCLSIIICVELGSEDASHSSEAQPGGWSTRIEGLNAALEEITAVSGTTQVLRAEIPKMGPEILGELMENAGIFPNWPDGFRELVHQGSQEGKPFHALELVRTLRDHGQIIEVPEHPEMLQIREGLSSAEINKAVPQDIYDGQIRRLKVLDPEERLVLHCASICGRSFSVTNIARGLNRPRLDVLRILQQIEDEHGFIEDVIEDDDRFRFLNTITIAALEQWLEKSETRGGHGRELVKEMHREVARKMIQARNQEEESAVSLGRIAFHCRHAGPSMIKSFREYTAQAAIAAANRLAWPEVFEQVGELAASLGWHDVLHLSAEDAEGWATEQGEELEVLEPRELSWRNWGELGLERRPELDLAWAKACTGAGGQENRDRARRLLKPVLDAAAGAQSVDLDLFPALSLYLEVTYEEEQVSELEDLMEDIEAWLGDESWGEALWRIACRFYLGRAENFLGEREARAHARLNKMDYSHSERVDRLLEFQAALVELQNDLAGLPEDRRRDLLMAKILLSRARQGAIVDGSAGGPKAEQRYNERMEEGLRLLGTHRDQVAIAQAYMDQAYHFLVLKEPRTAERYLERAQKTLEEVGSEQGISRLLRLRSQCNWARAADSGDPEEAEAMRSLAFDQASESLEIAKAKSRERDEVFAASQMLAYADQDDGRLQRVAGVFQWGGGSDGDQRGCLVDEDVWKEIHEGDPLRTRVSEQLKPLEQGIGWAWKLCLKLAWAKACHGRRGQENRDIARALLKKVLASVEAAPDRTAPFHIFEPVSLYLDITYAEKQRSDLEELISNTETWLGDPAWGAGNDGLTRIVARFFQLMAVTFRDEWCSGQALAQVLGAQLDELKKLRAALEAVELAEDSDLFKARDRYRARILREIAWAEVRLAEREDDRTAIFEELMNQSLSLSQRDRDLLGEAANYSMRGDFALSINGQHVQARDHFDKTLQRAHRAHYKDSHSKLHNRQARCAWLEAVELQRGTEFLQMTDQAFRLAWKAWQESRILQRERDQIHASINLMEFFSTPVGEVSDKEAAAYRAELLAKGVGGDSKRTLRDAMVEMGEGLDDAELWEEIYPADDLRTRVLDCLGRLKALETDWTWIAGVETRLNGIGEAEA